MSYLQFKRFDPRSQKLESYCLKHNKQFPLFSNKNRLVLLFVRENDLKLLVGRTYIKFFWPNERPYFGNSFVRAEPKLLIHMYRLGFSSKLQLFEVKCSFQANYPLITDILP